MSLRYGKREGASAQDTALQGGAPGKRAATDDLPVQRKAAGGSAPPSLAWSPARATDDPFALHLDGAVQKKDADATTSAPAAAASAGADKVAKLHYLVDVDVKDLGLKDLKEGRVGHTWISLEYNDPAAVPESVAPSHRGLLADGGKYSDPMGFWPKFWIDDEGVRRGGYSTNVFKSHVPGEVRHPDRAHEGAEKAVQTWSLTQKEVDDVLAYAESKRNAEYSVFFYNCTTFGRDAVKAAGKTPPSSSTVGICFPNAAYDGIKKNQDKGIGTTSVTDIDSGETSTVSGPDRKKQNGE
jgi:hypothetical protein